MSVLVPFDLPASPDAPLLLHGDSLVLLRSLPAASVDVVITDPPAGIGFMGKTWDSFKTYEPVTELGLDVHARLGGLLGWWAVGFVAFMVDVWSEVDRVLKPGGFVCAWALPKTADLAGLAMRSVGWDAHDSLLHLFGEGMPKGNNISKTLDKMSGAKRIGSRIVAADRWTEGGRQAIARGESSYPIVDGSPVTPEAKRWDGWNTALSPGHEQWLLFRKPTPLTYARNVLEHGCGALNIDATRTPASGADRAGREAAASQGSGLGRGDCYGEGEERAYVMGAGGRWPCNVLLSEGGEHCPVAELDRTTCTTNPGRCAADSTGGIFDVIRKAGTVVSEGSSGGASRFFPRFKYQAKAHDRTAGLRTDTINRHPTHKSVELMRWLARLLAAKAEHTGGDAAIVLDPFMGSGTTGVACVAERVRFIGIERDPVQSTDHDSFGVARSRIMAAIGSPSEAAEANTLAPVGAQLGLL